MGGQDVRLVLPRQWMRMSDEPYCPQCGGVLQRDAVDIGVGTMHGPAFCIDCGWSEDSGEPEAAFDSYEESDDAFD